MNKENLLEISQVLSKEAKSDQDDTDIFNDKNMKRSISENVKYAEEVINYYSNYNPIKTSTAAYIATCSSYFGIFATSLIATTKEITSITGGRVLLRCGWFFLLNFGIMVSSFYLRDEVMIDHQWFAQLLLCYRSSLLKISLNLSNYIVSNDGKKDVKECSLKD